MEDGLSESELLMACDEPYSMVRRPRAHDAHFLLHGKAGLTALEPAVKWAAKYQQRERWRRLPTMVAVCDAGVWRLREWGKDLEQ